MLKANIFIIVEKEGLLKKKNLHYSQENSRTLSRIRRGDLTKIKPKASPKFLLKWMILFVSNARNQVASSGNNLLNQFSVSSRLIHMCTLQKKKLNKILWTYVWWWKTTQENQRIFRQVHLRTMIFWIFGISCILFLKLLKENTH